MGKPCAENNKGKGRKTPKNTASAKTRPMSKINKKSQVKLNSDNSIAKSKQLISKLNATRSTSTRSSRTCKSNGPTRVCGNGVPMPSLAELERMYEDDSEDDNNNVAPNTVDLTESNDLKRCKTPVQRPLVISTDKLTSPTTLKVIGSKMMDLVSNLPVLTLDDDHHMMKGSPIIPPKKRKKSDTPYIVGCKERVQVPWAPKTSFCKGHEKYGVKEGSASEDEESSCPKKRRRMGKVNISKSILNAKSDEIALRLKQSQIVKSESSAQQRKRSFSSDSDKTVDYNFGAGSPQNVNRFSPLPSTSRDNDTFLQNDLLFNESLDSANPNKTKAESDNEIEIVDSQFETNVINDTLPVRKIEPLHYTDDDCETVIIDDELRESKIEPFNQTDDDCCVIIEPQPEVENMDTRIVNIYSPNDNGYGSLDFNLNFENDDCEIIDVDDVLAESQAIMAKYQKHDGLDSVTVVDPGRSYAPKPVNTSTPVLVPLDISDNNPIAIQELTENTSVITIEDVVTNYFVHQNNNVVNSSTTDITINPEIPRDWIRCISSLPLNNYLNHASNNNLNSSDHTVQSITPTVNSVSDPPAAVKVPAANTLNLVITDISYISSNRNETKKSPPAMTVVTPKPVEEISQKNSSRNFGDCPICMENLGNMQTASTVCGHIFCMECIKAAIQTNGKRCPTCRKVLKGSNGYHKLFL